MSNFTFEKAQNLPEIKADIKTIKSNEQSTQKLINQRLPELLNGIYAGDSPAIANSLLAACLKSRRTAVALFVKEFLPYEIDNGKILGKIKNPRKVAAITKKYTEFLATRQTVFTWIDAEVRVEKKPTDWSKKLQSDFKAALNDGLSVEDIMSILTMVIEEQEAA